MAKTSKEILHLVREVLEGITIGDFSFAKSVSVWDYSILDQARPFAIVLRPGPMKKQIDTYQDVWLNVQTVLVELSASFSAGSLPRVTTENLMDAVDAVDLAIMDNFHLGTGDIDEVQQAMVVGYTTPAVLRRQGQDIEWFTVVIGIDVYVLREASVGAE